MQYIEQRNPLGYLPGLVARAVEVGYRQAQANEREKQARQSIVNQVMLRDELSKNREIESERRKGITSLTLGGFSDITDRVGPNQPATTMELFGKTWQTPQQPQAPEGYTVVTTAPGKHEFFEKPQTPERWEPYEDPKFPGVMLERNALTGKTRKVADPQRVWMFNRETNQKVQVSPGKVEGMRRKGFIEGEPFGSEPGVAESRVLSNVAKLYKISDLDSMDPSTRGKVTAASVRAQIGRAHV